MVKIAIYGKGGIGKSTTTSNLSAALSMLGYRVMQIGCDPKADSTKCVMNGVKIPTVLDQIRAKGADGVQLEDIVFKGFHDILCVEAGGPTPGIGCAGLGIISALQKLEELNAFEVYQPDVVLYDVLGDVVCGGFAMPIRDGYAEHVFIVTSGEMMALFAASNISRAVDNFKNRGYAKVSGIILNERRVENEDKIVAQFAKEEGHTVIQKIRRSDAVQKAEDMGKTVIEALPSADIAADYRQCAERIMEICERTEMKKCV